jgi:hypothetical protein
MMAIADWAAVFNARMPAALAQSASFLVVFPSAALAEAL